MRMGNVFFILLDISVNKTGAGQLVINIPLTSFPAASRFISLTSQDQSASIFALTGTGFSPSSLGELTGHNYHGGNRFQIATGNRDNSSGSRRYWFQFITLMS